LFNFLVVVAIIILGAWAGFEYRLNQKIKQAELFYASSRPLDNNQLSLEERHQRALDGLQHFLDSEEKSELGSAAKLYLARVHADSNRISEAKDLFQQVIEQDQTSQMLKTIARISLVSLLEQEQDWNGARGMLDVLTQERWSDLQWFTQARIARQEGKVEEAKKHLQNLVNQSPDSVFFQTAETQMLLP
jgi:predicted negative regulator of RcsB-dependent stress response